MVTFHVGTNRYSFQEGSKEIIKKLVYDLNAVFGNEKCPFHPEEKWSIDIDLLSNGNLQFSSMKQNGCNYPNILLEKELVPFLDRDGRFPLPV